jgi:serpin B
MQPLALTAVLVVLVLVLTTSGFAERAASTRTRAVDTNAFGLDLYAKVRARSGNLFLSPYSIATALAMIREGAGGKTAAQMTSVLHLPEGSAAAGHRALSLALKPRPRLERNKKEAHELRIANAVWVQEGVEFEDAFASALEKGFGAPLETVDFTDPGRARRRINAWVDRETKGKIRDIVPPGKPPRDARIALANAIYFKAPWQESFDEANTKREAFTTTSGRMVRPKMMRQTERFAYGETRDAQILRLSYKGGETEMIFLLPKEKKGLPALEKTLTADSLESMLAGLQGRQVVVTIPKFTITCDLDLTETLPAMGMRDAFDPTAADFTGMNPEIPLLIGAVLHKAYVAVDEEGTEAAAASVVIGVIGGKFDPGKPVEFRADHPFLILIRHARTECVLFMGRVEDPTRS